MKTQLIAAALATLGLTACAPDITPQASSNAEKAAAVEPVVQAPQTTLVTSAQEEKKDEGTAPALEAKLEEGGIAILK